MRFIRLKLYARETREDRHLMNISVLWAKKSKKGAYLWLPLITHMTDTAEVAKRLWRKWLPDSIRHVIKTAIESDEQEAEKFIVFLAIVHDIGKATPVFQASLSAFLPTDLDEDIYNTLLANGYSVREKRTSYLNSEKTPHALASQLLLETAKEHNLSDMNLNRNAAAIIGAHHGKPLETGYTNLAGSQKSNFGFDEDAWMQAQRELIRFSLEYAGYASLNEVPRPTEQGQVLLSGLLILADWIASNDSIFPLVALNNPQKIDSSERARIGWNSLRLPSAWQPYYALGNAYYNAELFSDRFGRRPYNMQKTALSIAGSLRKPGIMVIEAPMGSGKTEAALAVAEVLRSLTDSGGIFFALPTQATSDGIFPRLVKWMDELDTDEKFSVNLAHGKAQFNETYINLFEGDSEISDDDSDDHVAYVHQWFNGRHKTMLANFVVGTIDQLLLMALKQRFVMLRHLGLAGKIVIIDECHAYDAYMSQYLKMALEWLGTYEVPVIVLSATLTSDKRREVIGAYMRNCSITGDWADDLSYPLITYSDGSDVKCCPITHDGKSNSVAFEYIAFEEVADKLKDMLSDGGCAGVVMDTVQRAQEMAKTLRECFDADTVELFHSRFIAPDRITKEKKLRDTLGSGGARPHKLVVVGTQVLEQSLDIDFDVMVSDIAPMDLLLQRMGRLHRHENNRCERVRKPICFITGIEKDRFSSGITSIYHEYILSRTKELLDKCNGVIALPTDIPRLVNDAYDKNTEQTALKNDWEKKLNEMASRAKSFRMRSPDTNIRATIKDWLNTAVEEDKTGKIGEATVRDADESIEVLVIKEFHGSFCLINGKSLPSGKLTEEEARSVAKQSISLPYKLCHPGIIGQTIKELEERTRKSLSKWLESTWLKGELFLILDENNTTELCGFNVTYTAKDGLLVKLTEESR